ncbi:hypothetical protein ACQ4WX_00655 [Streptomyces lasalocidi]
MTHGSCPGLRRLLRTGPGNLTGWDARLCVTAVAGPAALLEPVTGCEPLRAVAAGLPLPPTRCTVGLAQDRAPPTEDRPSPASWTCCTTCHWFDSAPLRTDLGRSASPGRDADAARTNEWYGAPTAAA